MSIIITLDEKPDEFTSIANASFFWIRESVAKHSDDAGLHQILEAAQYNHFLNLQKLTMAQREILAAGVARYRDFPPQMEMDSQEIAQLNKHIEKVHKYILTGVIE